jgi:hypothetical protein
LAEYLTLKQFAERRGMRSDRVAMQRLRRRLTKKQRRVREVFLIRVSDAENGPILVTEPMMRLHCPEFFDKRAEVIEYLKEYVQRLDESIAELKLRDRSLASRLRETRDMVLSLDRDVKVLQSASHSGQGCEAHAAGGNGGQHRPSARLAE